MATLLERAHRFQPKLLTLVGGQVVPGFKVKVADIFSILDEY